jgi:Arm DNA-binding domain
MIDTNMPLNDLAIKRAKPGPKIVKLSDGGGLQLWITPDGAKRWRLAYRFGGAQKVLAIGVYDAIGLKEARKAREAARYFLAHGQDPSLAKREAKVAQIEKNANTFDAIAAELGEKKRRDGKSPVTLTKFAWLLSFASPAFGARSITTITARDVLGVLKQAEGRGVHETARKMRTAIGDVFRYAIATGRAEGDPTVALMGALVSPTVTRRAAIIEPKAFGGLR